MLRRLVLATLLLGPSSLPVQAAEGWTVSCSQEGRVLHVEKLESIDAARERQLQLRYPGATCVFISDASTPLPADSQAPVGASADSLEAALRAITGENLPSSQPTPFDASTPPVLDLGLTDGDAGTPPLSVTEFETAPRTQPVSAAWVRLAIYKTDDVTEALGDWERIATLDPTFRFVTPAVTTADDGYVMLSAGPIPEADQAEFCLSAAFVGMDCVAGATPTPSTSEASLGLRYAAAQFPTVVSQVAPEVSVRPTFPRPAEYWTVGGKWSLTCYPALHVEPEFQPFVSYLSTYPPLPRPRPKLG